MAKLEMQKIELIGLLEESNSIVHRLQRRGVVEICSNNDEELVRVSTQSSIAQFERSISSAESALEILNKYCARKEPILSFLNGRKAVSTETFGEQNQQRCL